MINKINNDARQHVMDTFILFINNPNERERLIEQLKTFQSEIEFKHGTKTATPLVHYVFKHINGIIILDHFDMIEHIMNPNSGTRYDHNFILNQQSMIGFNILYTL